MNDERIEEIKIEIMWLAQQGLMAARTKNKEHSVELLAKTRLLVAELAQLTGDQHWKKLADEGAKLENDFNRRDN